MDELLGPLSDGKALVRLSVILGVCLAAVAWLLVARIGLSLSSVPKFALVIAALVLGFGVVFAGHVAWHYRRSNAGH